jgi:hypothetical protein
LRGNGSKTLRERVVNLTSQPFSLFQNGRVPSRFRQAGELDSQAGLGCQCPSYFYLLWPKCSIVRKSKVQAADQPPTYNQRND